MKTISFAPALFLFFFCSPGMAQVILYEEDFSSGSGPWTISYEGDGHFDVRDGVLEAYDMDSEGEWRSDVISLDGVNYAEITMNISWLGSMLFSNPDYIRVYFKIDDGEETLMFENIVQTWYDSEGSTVLSKVIKGSTVQIIIRTFSDTWLGLAYHQFDDIRVSEVITLYSRSSGEWADGANWSLQPFQGTQAPAGVYPTSRQGAIIGNGNTISLTGTEEVAFLEMHERGMLSLNRNALRMMRGGGLIVKSGGKIVDNNPSSALEFYDSYDTEILIDEKNGIEIRQVMIAGNMNLKIKGSGSVLLSDIIFPGSDSQLESDIPVTINGNVNVAGDDNKIVNRNLLNVSGSFQTSTHRFYLYNETSARINWGGNQHGSNFRLYANNPGSVFTYSRTGNQNIITPQDAYQALILDGSGEKFCRNNIRVINGLHVTGNCVFNAGSYTIHLSGDLNNESNSNDAFKEGTSTMVFNGGVDQSCISLRNESFYRLTVEKPGGSLLLYNTINIANRMTFQSGIVKPQDGNMVIFNDGATQSGASVASYIAGTVRKAGNQDFVFPVGDTAIYAPIGIFSLSNAAGSTVFSATYHSLPAPNPDKLERPISKVSLREYWNLERISDNGNNASCRVRLYWMDQNRSGIQDPLDLVVAHYNNSSSVWENLGSVNLTSNSLSSSLNVSNFSPFTIASITPDGLPVELVYFSGAASEEGNLLTWKTVTEHNNDYFLVEESIDGKNWKVCGKAPGNGTHTGLLSYTFLDKQPYPGVNYYRLKQVDFDGKYNYSDVISVNNTSVESLMVDVAPNPASSNAILSYSTSAVNPVKITVANLQGKPLLSDVMYPVNGSNKLNLDLSTLPYGMYLVIVEQNGQRKINKLMRN